MKRLLILFGLLLMSFGAQAANITVNSDRNPVRINESFTLTFTADGSVDDDPDFAPLETDFDILSRSSGSQTSFINGNFSSSKTWTLVLMPKQEGDIDIPSIAFGADHSPTKQIRVNAADNATTAGGSEVFMEMELAPKKAWAQSEIVLTVRLLSAINVSQVAMGQLKVTELDTVVEPLGDDRQYQTQRGNRAYLVVERKYALFPQRAGVLHIPAQMGEVTLSSGRSSFFDPFARSGQTRRVRAKAQEIRVLPIPADFHGKHWLAARNVQLIEEWSPNPPQFKVGEPVTRSLTLRADGVPAAQLPELQKYALAGIKRYPDQPALKDDKQGDGLSGSRSEKVALMPTQAGSYTLPEIRVPWWNTRTGKMEVARLAPRTIQVLPGSPGVANPPAAQTVTAQPMPAPTTTAPDTAASVAPTNTPGTPPPSSNLWPWISLALGLGWLVTLLMWGWSRRRQSPASTTPTALPKPSARGLHSAVIQACQQQHAPACKDALIAWGRARYPDAAINSLGDLAALVAEPLHGQLLQLNACLYGGQAADWQCHALAAAFKSLADEGQTTSRTSPRSDLQALNPP